MDYGRRYANKKLSAVDRELKKTYRTAQKELKEKLADFNRRFAEKSKEKKAQLEAGEITKEEYQDWLTGQVFIRNQWESQIKAINGVLLDHNRQAINLINNSTLDVFAESYNYAAWKAESEIAASFTIYNAESVARLILGDPQLLPEWKINDEKDYKWNQEKVNNTIRQAIIQGKGVDEITNELCDRLSTMNYNKMRMFARTAIGSAQEAGRYKQMEDAAAMGIEVEKIWDATHDNVTRDSHRALDGERVPYNKPFSNGLMFPKDPSGPPAEVYNCRCTMATIYPKYEDESKPDWRESSTIDGMSYEEWKKGKVARKSEEEEYESIWMDFVDERSWQEFRRSITSEQAAQLEKLLKKQNPYNMTMDILWEYYRDGAGWSEEINEYMRKLQSGGEVKKVGENTIGFTHKVKQWNDSNKNHLAISQAKTSDELNEALRNAGVFSSKKKTKIDGIDFEAAKDLSHAAIEMIEKYPWMKRFVNYMKVGNLTGADAEFTHRSGYNGNECWITVNKKSNLTNNRAVVQEAGKFHPVGTGDIASDFYHEFGHAMMFRLATKTGVRMDMLEKDVVSEALSLSGVGSSQNDIIKALCGYALHDDGEFVAEAVSEYFSSGSPRPLSVAVVKLLEQKAKGAGLK